MSISPSTAPLTLDDGAPSPQDIALLLATDGLQFLAFERQWSEAHARCIFNDLGDLHTLHRRLREADCDEFVTGMKKTCHEGELLRDHIRDFTGKMLKQWGLI